MGKLKITQEQYDKIILHEQASRSNLLVESAYDVVLGVAMLGGLKLTARNEINAEKALKDEKVLNLIKTTLEDKEKTKELIKKFEEKGMSDVKGFFSKNAQKIHDNFNTQSKSEKLDFIATTNLKELTDN